MFVRTAIAGFVVFPTLATAQVGPLEALGSDTGLDAIFRMVDLNGDRDFADAGEVGIFFDSSNASGLGSVAGSVFAIAQASDGSVYIGDGDTDSVYQLRDLNRDGDANDVGEANLFYSGVNGAAIQTPNGIAISGSVVFITNAGANPSTADAIVRCVDLNDDGDADDAGESTLWCDLSQVANSTPFGAVASGNSVCFVDLLGGGTDVVFRARDTNEDGVVDPSSELSVFVDSAAATTPVGFALARREIAGGEAFYVIESSGSSQALRRLTDTDTSGAIDASESVSVWSEALLAPGTLGTAFDVSIAEVGGVLHVLVPSSGTDAVDGVYVLADLNGGGRFDGPGETTAALGGGGTGVFPDTLRALAAYRTPAAACPADFNEDGFLDFFDYDAFVEAFESGAGLAADFNGDGFVDFFDYDAFVEAFETGC